MIRYRVVKAGLLPNPQGENHPHEDYAFAMINKYGLDHLSVAEVIRTWEDYSDRCAAGWLIDDKESIEHAFNVELEEIK